MFSIGDTVRHLPTNDEAELEHRREYFPEMRVYQVIGLNPRYHLVQLDNEFWEHEIMIERALNA